MNPNLVRKCLLNPKLEGSGAVKEEESMLSSSGSFEHNIAPMEGVRRENMRSTESILPVSDRRQGGETVDTERRRMKGWYVW
ncbi:hypothetical protein BCON_0043g00190 [Botryotinia convoluta]|uniref:Uncharacterized protein n=1 Tax=Botryotinia convoluta TaxID=54673 RepID=A0A4Z1ISE9_9HELO|nr:hypothetical protein BCON_0043g00190 [Botryotinia convoluta]